MTFSHVLGFIGLGLFLIFFVALSISAHISRARYRLALKAGKNVQKRTSDVDGHGFLFLSLSFLLAANIAIGGSDLFAGRLDAVNASLFWLSLTGLALTWAAGLIHWRSADAAGRTVPAAA